MPSVNLCVRKVAKKFAWLRRKKKAKELSKKGAKECPKQAITLYLEKWQIEMEKMKYKWMFKFFKQYWLEGNWT